MTSGTAPLAGKADDGGRAWSAITFGTVAWAGLVMVSAVAMLNVFLPAALWAFGLGGDEGGVPEDFDPSQLPDLSKYLK